MTAEIATDYKWQPIVLITDRRIECDDCGALAVFVILECIAGEDDTRHWEPLCQACSVKREEADE